MTREQIEKRVFEVVSRKLKVPVDAITSDATFKSLQLDSVEAFDILFAFEEEFSVSASDEVALQMSTLGEMVQLIYDLQKAS